MELVNQSVSVGPSLRNPFVLGDRIEVETSKTDEQGKAVHEECYIAKLKNKKPPAETSQKP